jgi:prepilin-type N-terminal cleavage/methylation domain-containing protein
MNGLNRCTPHHRMKGFSIVEIIVVIVIVGVFLAIVGPRIARALSGAEGTKHVTELTDLSACIRTTYNNRGDFQTFDANLVADRCGQANRRVVVGGTTSVLNPAGQTIAFAIATAAPFSWVDITSPGIPSDVCTNIMSSLAPNFVQITGTPVGGTATVVQAAGAVMDETQIPAACGQGTTTSVTMRINKG